MKVAIIDYNAGNIRSVENALRRLGVEPVLTADHDTIRRADKVVFPGQGEASSTMSFLRTQGLDEVIKSLKQPTLGICIGMQLMCLHSDEGDVDGLGVFHSRVRRFSAAALVSAVWSSRTRTSRAASIMSCAFTRAPPRHSGRGRQSPSRSSRRRSRSRPSASRAHRPGPHLSRRTPRRRA